jgi:hypothetical protein
MLASAQAVGREDLSKRRRSQHLARFAQIWVVSEPPGLPRPTAMAMTLSGSELLPVKTTMVLSAARFRRSPRRSSNRHVQPDARDSHFKSAVISPARTEPRSPAPIKAAASPGTEMPSKGQKMPLEHNQRLWKEVC